MKLLYCHDNVYSRGPSGSVYSPGQFPYVYWETFLDAFGDITVLGRQGSDNKNCFSLMNVSSGPDVSFRLLPGLHSPGLLMQNYRHVSHEIEQQVSGADAVVVRAVSDFGWIAYQHAKRMGKPIAMEMTACAWDSTWNHGSPYGRLYAPTRYLCNRIMAAGSDYVMYVSRHFLQRRYPSSGVTEAASNVRISPPSLSVLARRMSRIARSEPAEPMTLGLIGTLGNRLKGIHTALKALKVLHDNGGRDVVLRVLGPGDARPYLDKARQLGVAGRVIFDGPVPSGMRVLEWLDGIDIYIQPSYQEGVPRATIEAMSRGCPVIGSAVGGIPELLDQCCLHKAGDYNRLAFLLHQTVSDPDLCASLAHRNYRKAAEFTDEILMPRRRRFWTAFARHAISLEAPSQQIFIPNPTARHAAGPRLHVSDPVAVETGPT